MTAETAAALAERLQGDESLRQRVSQAMSVEELVRVVRDAGFTLTIEDVTRVERDDEISESDLESVSGGGIGAQVPTGATSYVLFDSVTVTCGSTA